jgi:hypothetical protein
VSAGSGLCSIVRVPVCSWPRPGAYVPRRSLGMKVIVDIVEVRSKTLVQLINLNYRLSLTRQAELLQLSRASLYY